MSHHLTPKQYLDDAIDEITLVRIYRNSDFDIKVLSNLSDIILSFDPTKYNQATGKNYVDNAIDEPTLIRNNKSYVFKNLSLSNISQITLNLEPTDDNHVVTKFHAVSLSQNNRNRRDLSAVFFWSR